MRSPAACDWVFEHAARDPGAPAIDAPGVRVTYGELASRVASASEALRRMGIAAGDHAVLSLPNTPAAVVASLALQHVGAVSVEVTHDWAGGAVAEVLEETSPRVAFFSTRDSKKMAPLLRAAGCTAAIVVDDSTAAPDGTLLRGFRSASMTDAGVLLASDAGSPAPAVLPDRDPSVPTLLLYTSGSTGRPRGVIQTAANVAANSRSIVEYLELTARDRAMLVLPLSYCYGKSVLHSHLFAGGSVFLDSRFACPRVVLDAIAAERCTGFSGVPLTFELLRRNAGAGLPQMPGLRYVTQAGGPMRQETIAWAREAFAPAPLFVMYGQTEATARLTYLPPANAVDKVGSVGIPVPGVEMRVVDEGGVPLQCGGAGHIVARGPSIAAGYHSDPEETSRVFRDGWLWTGDLGIVDEDGFFYVVGRAQEMLEIGGHRVSPAQIEAVFAQHPDVVDVAVGAVPDGSSGEAAAALVTLRPGAVASESDLREFCSARLAPYLVPTTVRFVAQVPRGANGKLLRERVACALASRGDAVNQP